MSLLDRLSTSNWLSSHEDMAQFLERYFGWRPSNDHNEWDDFENLKLRNAELESCRNRILEDLGPINGPLSSDQRADAEAKARGIIISLRQSDAATQPTD